MTEDIHPYDYAEDRRRVRRLELFVRINQLRDRLRRESVGLASPAFTHTALAEAEREYAELMAISRKANFGLKGATR